MLVRQAKDEICNPCKRVATHVTHASSREMQAKREIPSPQTIVCIQTRTGHVETADDQ
jgi:hypothetical protein